MLGDIIVLTEDSNIIGQCYSRGDRFKIIGEKGMRGLIQSERTGQKIYEIAMISNKFVELSKWRDMKLNDIL